MGPADFPAANSSCSTDFQTSTDLPACPATVLPAVPASACAAAKACPDLPASSTCPAAELPATAAGRCIPKPRAAEAVAEHSGSASTAEFPTSAAAHCWPGHRLWRKPFQPDQLQQQLCPV